MYTGTREADSKRMLLQLIFDTRTYDVGQYWITGGLHGDSGILRQSKKNTSDIASLWESYAKATAYDVELVNEWIQKTE